ncbi:Uma2 family endonuclease [Streptomyces sp. UNOC14_S4]|uniref:Uma2 family endonuclease n=1 Tax=Streptomyces sp. UNOC14_S4 TaxID=2872340 RepID=UPI001E6442CD|nr:Uma2 family endonuclease [Streptomyces sp. UNOC14_S4]MCC3768794.1 Uma2 family endonuclease [Streptomyces sp. UNOC14_S4]
MTGAAERTSRMLVEDFEQIASAAPETVMLEFIDGRIREKPAPDGDHSEIVAWLLRRCMQVRPELGLYTTRGLKVEAYRRGRARPDGALVPVGHFAGHGEWSDPDGVLMTVEVTSYEDGTERHDRQEKTAVYAAVGIPVHLLIDRTAGTVIVHTNPDPERGYYADTHRAAVGEQVTVPDPVNITLDTEILKNYVR